MTAPATLRPARYAQPRLTVRGLGNAFVNFFLRLDATYRSRTHLQRLDDRLLRDIGLSRADVAAELRRPLI